MIESLQVYVKSLFTDVELPLTSVALVLLVTILDAGIDISWCDPEYLDAIMEEHAIVQHIELGLLDLLDVAQELVLLPF